MRSRYDGARTVTVTDLRTGDMIKAYHIYNPFANEYTITFFDNTRFMVFFEPEEPGSAYIYLFDGE